MVPERIKMAEVAIWFAYGKRFREKLKTAGAFSKETEKTIGKFNLSERKIRNLKRNVWAGKTKETEDGCYYVPVKMENTANFDVCIAFPWFIE